jgi:hypothetical protein
MSNLAERNMGPPEPQTEPDISAAMLGHVEAGLKEGEHESPTISIRHPKKLSS